MTKSPKRCLRALLKGGYIGVILGWHRNNGKENGNFRDYIRFIWGGYLVGLKNGSSSKRLATSAYMDHGAVKFFQRLGCRT